MDNFSRGVVVVTVAFLVICLILDTCSEKRNDKNGEKIAISAGINSSAEVLKAIVDEKDAKVYNGNVIVHCRCANDNPIIQIDVLVPRVQADQLAVGDTIFYVQHLVNSSTKDLDMHAIIGFFVDKKITK